MRRLAVLLTASAALILSPLRANNLLEEVRRLPESNPYRAALERYTALPAEERERLEAWASPADESAMSIVLSAPEKALVHELSDALIAAAKAPPLTNQDWPITPNPDAPENAFATLPLPVGPMRKLSQLSVKAADALPADDAMEIYAAVAQFGRNQRAGSTLIQQLTGVAIEGIALAGPTRRLAEFTPEQLQRLADAWAGLHPLPSLEQSLSGERDQFFHPFVEKILRPGLHDMIAKGNKGAEDDTDSFPRDLRLSGLMDLGGGERQISLENVADRTHFTLRIGQTAENIELVSMDFPKRQAVIRRGEREAVIDLESKQITERKLSSAQIRDYLKSLAMFSDEDEQTLQRLWLKRINENPRGVDGYLDDLRQEYDRQLDLQITRASMATIAANDSGDAGDPLITMTMPTLGKIARTLNNSATQATMLQAAIHHRLDQLGESHRVAPRPDPWAENDRAFAVEPTPDGGFLLRSAYEAAPGASLTYKFAAPDAGFVRVPAKP